MAWAASTQCAGGRVGRLLARRRRRRSLRTSRRTRRKWTRRRRRRWDTAARESYPCHLHRGQKRRKCCRPQFLARCPSCPCTALSECLQKNTRLDIFNFCRFTKLDSYKIGKLQSGGRTKCVQQLVCLHPVCILGQILHFCYLR